MDFPLANKFHVYVSHEASVSHRDPMGSALPNEVLTIKDHFYDFRGMLNTISDHLMHIGMDKETRHHEDSHLMCLQARCT